MKLARPMCALATVVALLALSTPAMASTNSVTKVNVPFAFVAGGRQMPAGEYLVSTAPGAGLLSLANASGAASTIFVQSTFAHPTAKPQFVFKQVGGKYYLSEVRPNLTAGTALK